ncbi:MAG: type II CRISPR-associated endonuclease Cas1 [Bacteroidales bacterium]|nr:type II CRISPR-associated endonuclease Cas1 [Bacteroidales bacterium]
MLKRTIFFSKPSRLNLKDNQLVINLTETSELRSVPIEDIGFVVVENMQVSITLPLLSALNENNIAVVFCNEKHMPSSMLLNLDSNNIQGELFSQQIAASEPLKKQLWKQTVEQKITNQSAFLKKLGFNYKDLYILANEVKSGDTDNREGVAARLYWPRLFGKEFVRDRYGEPPNPLLNYGYIILRAAVARALAGSGLLSTLGIFHKNRYNAFCLADDIMEPYRPWVDEAVYKIWNSEGGRSELNTQLKMKLLEILTADVEIGKNMRPLMVALSQTSASLARCFAGDSKKIQYPDFKHTI